MFYRLFGLSWENILTWLLVYMTTVFFSDDVLRGNWIIKEVVLVEASSVLPLPGWLESC